MINIFDNMKLYLFRIKITIKQVRKELIEWILRKLKVIF